MKKRIQIVLLTSVWIGAIACREVFIPALCGDIQNCLGPDGFRQIDSLIPPPTSGVIRRYDQLSDLGQWLAGITVFLAAIQQGWPDSSFKKKIKTTALCLFQAAATNGILLEIVRIWVRRPRPYIEGKLLISGVQSLHLEASQFTSFYSGHTSFAFASLWVLFRTLRGSPNQKLTSTGNQALSFYIWLSSGTIIATSTAILRVLAGRHHLTDVLFGAFFGLLSAIVSDRAFQRK